MTAGEQDRPLSRPGQYWHVHECRWVRWAEQPSPAPIVVPEQGTTMDEVAAVETAQ